jgi:hypothetical protein
MGVVPFATPQTFSRIVVLPALARPMTRMRKYGHLYRSLRILTSSRSASTKNRFDFARVEKLCQLTGCGMCSCNLCHLCLHWCRRSKVEMEYEGEAQRTQARSESVRARKGRKSGAKFSSNNPRYYRPRELFRLSHTLLDELLGFPHLVVNLALVVSMRRALDEYNKFYTFSGLMRVSCWTLTVIHGPDLSRAGIRDWSSQIVKGRNSV